MGRNKESKASTIIDSAAGLVGSVLTTKKQKLEEYNKREDSNQKDRENAREMYKADSQLQKWYALVFLIIFILALAGMMLIIAYFTIRQVDAPDWAIAFLSTIFGTLSMKLGTVTDFLFGGSKTAEIQERRRGK